MMPSPAKLTEKIKKAIRSTRVRNGWTNKQFAEIISERLPNEKRLSKSGVVGWQNTNNSTPATISSFNFRAIYPLIASDLKMLEWVPTDPRVKKFVDEFEADKLLQGKLFDDDTGQTVDSTLVEIPTSMEAEASAATEEERDGGAIHIRCSVCNNNIKSRWKPENGDLVLFIDNCKSCSKKTGEAIERLIADIRLVQGIMQPKEMQAVER